MTIHENPVQLTAWMHYEYIYAHETSCISLTSHTERELLPAGQTEQPV